MKKLYPDAAAALDGLLKDGLHIACGGFGLCGIPERLLDAVRDKAKNDEKIGEALAQYLHKGDPVLIQGEPYLRSYTAKDGSERQSLECDVKEWAFVSSKGGQSGGEYAAPQASKPKADFQAPVDDGFGDLPF